MQLRLTTWLVPVSLLACGNQTPIAWVDAGLDASNSFDGTVVTIDAGWPTPPDAGPSPILDCANGQLDCPALDPICIGTDWSIYYLPSACADGTCTYSPQYDYCQPPATVCIWEHQKPSPDGGYCYYKAD